MGVVVGSARGVFPRVYASRLVLLISGLRPEGARCACRRGRLKAPCCCLCGPCFSCMLHPLARCSHLSDGSLIPPHVLARFGECKPLLAGLFDPDQGVLLFLHVIRQLMIVI